MSSGNDRVARLDDYERGVDLDADAFEEDLFARALAGEAPELAFRDSLRAGVRAMVGRGTFEMFPSARDVAELRARTDLRVAYYDLGRVDSIVLDLEADVVITRVPVDLARADRVDVEVGFEGGGVLKTMPDVAFERHEGALYLCCEGELARHIQGRPFGRIWAIEGGARRLLTEVTIGVSG